MFINLTDKSKVQLASLPKQLQERISKKLNFFANQEDPLTFAKYISTLNLYRFRIGDYRALFTIRDNIIHVVCFVRRDKAYNL